MEKTAFDARYDAYRQAVEAYLSGLFVDTPHWADLYESMRYSILAGGKRIRPVLTLEFARLAGMDWHSAIPVACALELVHTYSLIHDDLPCMDDDDLRRGKPTNHKVYGETLAVLAGDALQPEAFRLILTAPGLAAEQRAACALILAKAAGADGMVAGQVIDTLHAPQTKEELTEVHRLKTGAMIAGACMLGVSAAGGAEELRKAAEEYGYQLGIKHKYREGEFDQVDRVLYDLKHNPASRRIMTNIYNHADLNEMNLYPCAYSMTFNVTGKYLNGILNQRSQDMLTANNWNVVQYATLLCMFAQVSGLIPGEFVHVIADAHIYDRHIPLVKEMLEREQFEAPKFSLNPAVTNFYDFKVEDVVFENYQANPTGFKIPVAI